MNHEHEKISYDLYGDGIGRVELIQSTGTDETVVRSARVSFGRDGAKEQLTDRDKKLINYLIKHQHSSTLEHCSLTCRITVPLYIRSQHHRHRTWCLAGDTEVTFNKPDRWKKGQHCKQTGYKGQKFTLERLYKNWNDPKYRSKLEKMLVRVWDEKEKVFTVSNLADVIYSGVKTAFRVTLEDGKYIDVTDDHQLMTKEGWLAMKDAIGLEVTNTNKATMSKECFLLTNGTENLWKSYDWMKLQRQRGLSVQEMADNAGCSYHTIRKWLARHSLQFTTEECLSNLSGANGKPPWNKGKKGYKTNRVLTEEHKEAIRKARSGANSNFWKGGVSSERVLIGAWTRNNAKKVHEKFDYTCQVCEKRGGKLDAHHMLPVVEYPEYARDFDNLVTVCKPCHYKIHGKDGDRLMGRNKKGTPLSGRYKKVVSVEYLGEIPTYDLTIAGDNHNFVANGIVVHNCFNEISRRYTDMDLVFYEPKEFRTQHKSNRQASNPDDTINPHIHGDTVSELVKEHHEYSLSLYNDMMEAGVCREQARGILPQNLYTTYWATVDLNNLFKFICLRLHEGAQWEIQKVAEALFRMSYKLWPYTSEALANNCWDDYTKGKLQEILEEEKRYAAQMSFEFKGGC